MLLSTIYGPPPPLDRHPDFPLVCFNEQGDPLLIGPQKYLDLTIHHIVPGGNNPFVRRFGEGDYRNWAPPEAVFQMLEFWRKVGLKVTVHPRRPGVTSAGVSRGKARFLCGGGMTVFVVVEKGLLPVGKKIDGIPLDGMVATLGVAFPNTDNSAATLHIIPAEYLVDPPLPALPRKLSPAQLQKRLPPPPEFYRSDKRAEYPGFYFAFVSFDISEKEEEEGGGSIGSVTVRGSSYWIDNGLASN